MDITKWAKDAEPHKKKDREEKDALKAKIEKLKVENTPILDLYPFPSQIVPLASVE